MTTILVVEDDQDIRILLSETVLDLGYDVLEAADGGSGLRRALEEHPDVMRAMRGGAWGYVIKPWNQDDLESKINNAVEEVLQEQSEL